MMILKIHLSLNSNQQCWKVHRQSYGMHCEERNEPLNFRNRRLVGDVTGVWGLKI